MHLNDYFSDPDSDYAFRELQRKLERARIRAQAHIILSKKEAMKQDGKEQVQTTAQEIKQTIKQISGQMETTIKGQFRTAIEDTVSQYGSQYDTLTNL